MVYPKYDSLDEFDQRALESAIPEGGRVMSGHAPETRRRGWHGSQRP